MSIISSHPSLPGTNQSHILENPKEVAHNQHQCNPTPLVLHQSKHLIISFLIIFPKNSEFPCSVLEDKTHQSSKSLHAELNPISFHSITERYLLLAMSRLRLHLQISVCPPKFIYTYHCKLKTPVVLPYTREWTECKGGGLQEI